MTRLLTTLTVAALVAACADAPFDPMAGDADATADVSSTSATRTPETGTPSLSGAIVPLGTVIDFESLASGTGPSYVFMASYSEDGFTMVNPASSAADAFGAPQASNTDFYQGSMALVNNNPNGVTLLTKDDGGTFTAGSIDIAELQTLDLTPREVPFTGTRADGSTVTATLTTDGVAGFETFVFDGFTDLVSLSWVQVPPYHQFDNINLDPPEVLPGEPDPLTKDACFNGGWQDQGFKNQGQCVRMVETGKDSR